jgi:hypothetical protein
MIKKAKMTLFKFYITQLGGTHNHEYLPTWADELLIDLLQHRTRIGQGHNGVVYRVTLGDASVIAKVGFIESREVATQRYACRLGHGLPVYAAHLNVDLGNEIDKEICPHCGPKWRFDAFKSAHILSRDDLWCWCDKVKDVLLMPEAVPVLKQDATQADEDALYNLASQIMDYAHTALHHSPEIKTVMRYRGRYVFVDFGDPLFIEMIFANEID